MAWVELKYRPHAYQAPPYEHEFASEVLTSLPFTNAVLSKSRIQENPVHFHEHCSHLNGHHKDTIAIE